MRAKAKFPRISCTYWLTLPIVKTRGFSVLRPLPVVKQVLHGLPERKFGYVLPY